MCSHAGSWGGGGTGTVFSHACSGGTGTVQRVQLLQQLLSIHRTLSGGRHCCPSTGLCQGDVTVVHPQDSVREGATVVSTAVLCTSHGEQPSQWSVLGVWSSL